MKKLMLFMLAALLGIVAANAQGTGTVVVADGTTTNSNVPFYGTFADDNYQRSQVIYPESILSDITGAEIQGITWYLNSAAVAFNGLFRHRSNSQLFYSVQLYRRKPDH
jgi:restriction endonuclease S subunit